MWKPFAKKLLLIGGVLALMVVAFFAGSIALSSAHAASATAPNKKCDTDPKCKKASQSNPGNMTKSLVTVTSVSGNTIQATFMEPSDKKGSAVTILTTSGTKYVPDQSIVAVGKTIGVGGTVNSNGSITAEVLAFYDPTISSVDGVITKIEGSTITVQLKDRTSTILVTATTTFVKAKETPASLSDLKVGMTIRADGKLNSDGSLTATRVGIFPSGDVKK